VETKRDPFFLFEIIGSSCPVLEFLEVSLNHVDFVSLESLASSIVSKVSSAFERLKNLVVDVHNENTFWDDQQMQNE
jgi:hypothetical protein